MVGYKPSLKLSQFKKVKREYTEEDMQAAIKKASARYMEPEILHDVKISGIIKDSVKFNENNRTWIQFGMELENAAGERASYYMMIPVGQELTFTGRSGTTTSMPLANFGSFLNCLGMNGMNTAFIDRVIETDCEVLNDLIGFQLRYVAKWNKKKVHGWYDPEKQSWFLVDSKGMLVIDEPFQLPSKDECESADQRWAEMVNRAQEEGFSFESNPTGQILPNPNIANPIAQLGIAVRNDKAAIEAAHQQSKPKVAATVAAKPKVGVVAKPTTTKTVVKKAPPPPPPVEEEEVEEEEFDPEEFDQEEVIEE